MGGAFIAIADDATAASWNPAGLIQLERPELSAVIAYSSRKEEFSSDTHPEINNTGKVTDFSINYFSGTYPFQWYKNMIVSINYQSLYEFERSFDHLFDFSDLGVSLLKDVNYEQNGCIGALGFAYAIEITPKLSFGVTFNVWTHKLFLDNEWEDIYIENAVGTQGGVPVTIDTRITDKYSEFSGFNANFGILWNFNDYLTVGTVLKTPFEAYIRHEFNFTQTSVFGPPINNTVTSEQNIEEDVDLRMPASYGLGLAWRVSDALTFSLDVYHTHWSSFILTDSQGNKFSPIDGQPANQSDVSNTVQIRIGGEYLFISNKRLMVVPARVGLFYDPEPSHGQVKNFYGFALGSGISYKRAIFDVAYQLRWGHDVDTGNLIATSKADIKQHLIIVSLIIHF